MPLESVGLNLAADGVRAGIVLMSLHTANPGATGTNEVSGGGYARKTITWGASSGGISSATGSPVAAFTGPASQAITHVGYRNSGGTTWYGSVVPTGDLAFNAAGQLNVTAATITATNGP